MDKVRIVADSSICLPRELIEKYHIELVPETIIFGDRIYRDGVDLDPQEFYKLLSQAEELPTTSAPSPQDFTEAYQKVAKEANGIACVLVTTGFSKMGLEAALAAKTSFSPYPLEVVDSRAAVGAYGFVALAAARAAAEGKTLPEVLQVIEDMKERVTTVFTLNTLKYLAKGGRIGKAASLMSGLLNVKPILEVPTSTGVIEPLQRVRTRQKALQRLLEIMEEKIGASKPVHVSIDHANVIDDANRLKSEVSSRFDCAEVYINNWAPVAGVHCGPGTIGLSFYTGE
jgi:DegV family protein with EDD domain